MSIHDEDQQSLIIQAPKEEKAKISAHLSSWEYQIYTEDPQEAKIYLVVSNVYLRNLLTKIEDPRLTEAQRKYFGPQCIILQQLQIEWIIEDGFHRLKDTYRASICINYHQYKGLDIVLRLGELDVTSDDTVQAKLIYYNHGDQINYKTYRMDFTNTQPNALSFRIDDTLFDQYFKPALAVQFTIKKQPVREKRFRGIQNEGNTCYMNSTLQILYFLRPLRKAIIQFEGKSELMRTIKKIFIDLLDVEGDSSFSRSVNASELLSAYGRFPDPRKQQDIHQFLLGFLDQLEGELPSLKELWIGHGKQILSSRDSQKPYQSSIAQQFNEIDLLLSDHKGNTLGQMSDALHRLLQDQFVQDKIETDQYGKVQVKKTREIIGLPNVVFFNLKRYMYNKNTNRSSKILADFEYPSTINLSFLQNTPTGEEEDYILYGVAVHRGQTYNSGHYYAFVNTSSNPSQPHWIKFNDSFVHISSQETALSFKGGKHRNYVWSKEYQRFIEKDYKSQQTAYMLVYIRRDKFMEYQNIRVSIPKQWVLNKRREEQRNQAVKTQSVELLILEPNMDYDLFDDGLPTIPIDLKDDQELLEQLRKIGPNLLGCKVASIWKVIRRRRKIRMIPKCIDLPETPSRIFGYKQGHSMPDYILIVPESFSIARGFGIESIRQKLGIVNTLVKENEIPKMSFSVISKSYLQDHKTEEEKRLEKHGYFDREKDRFTHDWTDYCTIRFD